jgi:RimJ/RimL family protein N-acetyltransferase
MRNPDTATLVAETFELADETPATVRPITPADAAALVKFHGQLSQRAITLRYFYPHLELPAEEVAHLTEVDGRDRVALVVERAGDLIAVARYDRLDDPDLAEVAFLVADEFQHHGIATMLLQRLAERARQVGITHLIAEVMGENKAMLGVFHEAGFPTESKFECGTVELKMCISAAKDEPPGR